MFATQLTMAVNIFVLIPMIPISASVTRTSYWGKMGKIVGVSCFIFVLYFLIYQWNTLCKSSVLFVFNLESIHGSELLHGRFLPLCLHFVKVIYLANCAKYNFHYPKVKISAKQSTMVVNMSVFQLAIHTRVSVTRDLYWGETGKHAGVSSWNFYGEQVFWVIKEIRQIHSKLVNASFAFEKCCNKEILLTILR